ncbi:histidine phosphatase family protein [Peterkaempfera bronchialis]|uniref:Histidine phosphatase family protein n=1 Tax=Peterkaempfera bronchialis TaxID=2126346 RepID=A0A345T2X8_9ACTN|nr:histidine phosphatase family protein [Peterkaempfera bronchialis]AXI80333.1 histidine phosphatase family protein [Peterkaempfera bronchialis]
MTVRVIFISAAGSAALREARFDDGGPLDAAGLRRARTAAGTLPPARRSYASPTARCRETAEALGLAAEPVPALGGCAMGRWRGRRLDEVMAAEPEAVAGWLSDPSCAPHGGESLLELHTRVAGWLDALPGSGLAGSGQADSGQAGSGRVVVVAEPDVVRAALVHALGAPPQVFWRLDVPPLTATELSGRDGRWNLRCGTPLGS